MSHYMQFPTADGGTILVEVEAQEQITSLVKAGLGEKVHGAIVAVRDTFESTMMETVRRNTEAFVKTLLSLSLPPSEAQISFGINAVAEVGYSAVAKVSSEATYTVTLKWKQGKAQATENSEAMAKSLSE